MRWCCNLCVWGLLLTGAITARASDPPVLAIYLNTTAETRSAIPDWHEAAFDRAIIALEQREVAVTQYPAAAYDRTGGQPKLFAVVTQAESGVTLTTDVHSPHLLPSAVLYESTSQPLSIEVVSAEDVEHWIAGLGLYAVDRCDDANSLWEGRTEAELGFYRGNCDILAGEYQAAEASYTGLLEVLDEAQQLLMPDVSVNLAWVHLQQGDPERAFEAVNAAIAALEAECCADGPATINYARLIADRGQLHALNFDFDAAIEDASQAIEIADEYDLPYALTAQFYKERGDHIFLIYEWDRVLADYDRAIELDPALADAYFARGVLYYTQGPRASALSDFERFAELASDSPRLPEAETYIDSITIELDALAGDDTGPFGPSN